MVYYFVRKMANKADAARNMAGRFRRCTELPYPPPKFYSARQERHAG